MDKYLQYGLIAAIAIIIMAGGYLLIRNVPKSSISGANTTANTTSIAIVSIVTINSSAQVYGPSTELPNISPVDSNASVGTFYCNASSDCAVVHTRKCFNNQPYQQACINQGSYDS